MDSLWTRRWHDKNIQSNAPYRQVLITQLNHLASLAKWLSVRLRTKLSQQVNNRNIKKRSGICSQLIKVPEWQRSRSSWVFIFNFEQIHILLWYLHCWLPVDVGWVDSGRLRIALHIKWKSVVNWGCFKIYISISNFYKELRHEDSSWCLWIKRNSTFLCIFPGTLTPFQTGRHSVHNKIFEILGINSIYDFYKDDKLLLD